MTDFRITKHQNLLDGNRMHIWYSAYKDGHHGSGRTRQEAIADWHFHTEEVKNDRVPLHHDRACRRDSS